jgi:hypothetical protein
VALAVIWIVGGNVLMAASVFIHPGFLLLLALFLAAVVRAHIRLRCPRCGHAAFKRRRHLGPVGWLPSTCQQCKLSSRSGWPQVPLGL